MEPTPASASMTEEQLKALIAKTAGEAIGPAVAAALEPLTKAQGDMFARLAGALKPEKADDGTFDNATLGKWPYGRKARALALAAIENGSQDPDAAAFAVKRAWGVSLAEPTVKWLSHVKGLTVGSPISAGDMVFPTQDPEWIDLLRNNTVVRARCRTIPMPRGASSRRKQTGAATATYQGELGPIVDSSQTVGRVNLSYKKLTAATVESNDLIRFSGSESDRIIQEDLLAVTALREDRALLLGNPPVDAGSPQGIRFQTIAANIAASAGTSLANFQADLTSLASLVQSKNILATPENSSFVMSVSTKWIIYALATTTGDWIFAAGLAAPQPQILGFPVVLSTQLEVSNSWMGASTGLIGFIHWPSMEIHDSMARTVEAFRGGAYRDSTGTIQSGISNDETVITCIAEHDFLQKYDVAAAWKTGLAT